MCLLLIVLVIASVYYAIAMKVSMMALLAYLIEEKHVDLDNIPKNEIKKYTSRAARKFFGLK